MLLSALSSAPGCPWCPSPTCPLWQATDKEVASKIDEFIGKLKQLKEVHSSFTFVSMRKSAAPFGMGEARGGFLRPCSPVDRR